MKKILLIVLLNIFLIALIYSTYIKSRRTTTEIPKGASVVSEDNATPDDRILYGREYASVDVEIYIEDGLDEEYVKEVQETVALFPAGVAASLPKNNMQIILVSDFSGIEKADNKIFIKAESRETVRYELIKQLCSYTDKVYEISELEVFKQLTEDKFENVMTMYVTDKRSLQNENKELCEYLDTLFKDKERIDEILNSQ